MANVPAGCGHGMRGKKMGATGKEKHIKSILRPKVSYQIPEEFF
jgi:hypothetical protein